MGGEKATRLAEMGDAGLPFIRDRTPKRKRYFDFELHVIQGRDICVLCDFGGFAARGSVDDAQRSSGMDDLGVFYKCGDVQPSRWRCPGGRKALPRMKGRGGAGYCGFEGSPHIMFPG